MDLDLEKMANMNPMRIMPRHLKSHLDQFVVGQQKAKRILSVAVYNHYLRIQSLLRCQNEENEIFRENICNSYANDEELSDAAHEIMSDFPGQTAGKVASPRPAWPVSSALKSTTAMQQVNYS